MTTKTVHMAAMVRQDGAVSARCFTTTRPINLKQATWTNRNDAVTCPKCLARLRADKLRATPPTPRTDTSR